MINNNNKDTNNNEINYNNKRIKYPNNNSDRSVNDNLVLIKFENKDQIHKSLTPMQFKC